MGSREGCSSPSIVQAAFGHAPETWPTSSEGASVVPGSLIEVSTQNERFIMPPEIFDEDEKKYVASQPALTGWICDFDVSERAQRSQRVQQHRLLLLNERNERA